MTELSVLSWVLLAAAAAVIGLSKAALPGAGTLAVALFAAAMPAKESTAAMLVLLIVGDAFALWAYHRHADIRTLLRLAPAVIVGVVGGAVFLALASDAWVRRMIAIILLAVIAFTLWRRRRVAATAPGRRQRRAASAGYGALGGFTTMVANAGGPVMSMYFLAMRFPVKAFLGTAAWFFAAVNITKVPFSVALGLLTPRSLLVDLVLAPVVVVFAFVGRWIAGRMTQTVFDRAIIVLTVVGALYLLV